MEKIQIHVTGHAYGQASVHIPDTIIQKPLELAEQLGKHVAVTEDKGEQTATVKLDYSKVILSCSRSSDDESRWRVKHATINLARLRFGHNARLIVTDDEFFSALTIANNLVNQIVTADSQDLLIPGVVPRSRSYFTYLETAHQVPDPDGIVMKAFSAGRLLYYNERHRVYMHCQIHSGPDTVYLGGKDPLLAIYRKDKEVFHKSTLSHNVAEHGTRWLLPDDQVPCVRIEARLRKQHLVNTLTGEGSRYAIGDRIRSFTLQEAQQALQTTLNKVRGVYASSLPSAQKVEFRELTEALISELESYPEQPSINEFLEKVQKRAGYSDVTVRKLRSNLERHRESVSTLELSSLVPTSGESPPMHLTPMRKSQRGHLVPMFTYASHVAIDPRVRAAYSETRFLNIHDSDAFLSAASPPPFHNVI